MFGDRFCCFVVLDRRCFKSLSALSVGIPLLSVLATVAHSRHNVNICLVSVAVSWTYRADIELMISFAQQDDFVHWRFCHSRETDCCERRRTRRQHCKHRHQTQRCAIYAIRLFNLEVNVSFFLFNVAIELAVYYCIVEVFAPQNVVIIMWCYDSHRTNWDKMSVYCCRLCIPRSAVPRKQTFVAWILWCLLYHWCDFVQSIIWDIVRSVDVALRRCRLKLTLALLFCSCI